MASLTDWKPSLDGEELTPLAAYDALVDEGDRPFLRTDPDWAAKTIQPQLAGIPNAALAIQESILALWRLKQLEGDLEGAEGEFKSRWQQHVSAWLHRHRDLCLEVQTLPIQVVLDFVDGMVRTRNLPEAMVPSWQGDMPVSTQEKGFKGKERASATEEDVEMLEPGQDEAPKPTKTKGKAKKPVPPTKAPTQTSQLQSTTNGGNPEAGDKRMRTSTPDEEGQSKKRLRTTRAVPSSRSLQTARTSRKIATSANKAPKKVGRISLGQYEFKEFDEVTKDLVPGIMGKVCNYCKGSSQRDACVPLWVLKKGDVDIACMRCKNARRGCSFTPQDLGVADPPTVVYTTVSAAFRAELAKRGSHGRKTLKSIAIEDDEDDEDNEEEVVEEEVDNSTRSGVRMSISVQDTGEDVPPMVGEQVEITRGGEGVGNVGNVRNLGAQVPSRLGGIPASIGVVPPSVGGRTYVIFHEDASHIERQLIDPDRTMMSLEQAKIELWGAIDREEQQLVTIRELTRRRKWMWQSMEYYIDKEIDSMGGYGSKRKR